MKQKVVSPLVGDGSQVPSGHILSGIQLHFLILNFPLLTQSDNQD